MNNHTAVEVARIPNCDLCHQHHRATPAVVDGKTVYGPWAHMCEDHYEDVGIGLGLGRGQRLILRATS